MGRLQRPNQSQAAKPAVTQEDCMKMMSAPFQVPVHDGDELPPTLPRPQFSKPRKILSVVVPQNESERMKLMCAPFKVPTDETKVKKRRAVRGDSEAKLQQPTTKKLFVQPRPLDSEHERMLQKLLSTAYRVPIDGYTGVCSNRPLGMKGSKVRQPLYDPYAEGALVVYTPPELSSHDEMHMDPTKKKVHVVVDPALSRILRPHQREGVRFMFECVTGARLDEGYSGCVMADEMGLGKTLQCITLLWTLLRQGPEASPTINKAIIVCPASLVMNWDREIVKWLSGKLNSLPIVATKKEEVMKQLNSFISQVGTRNAIPVIIISYESLRLYTSILARSEVGLVLCDEGHRLKNGDSQTYQALRGLKCHRRVLLSGTPIQNDLLEYYSLIDFVNPGMLGTEHEFKRKFENPIQRGRDADATDKQIELGNERLSEMLSLVNRCIIRRTAALLTKYLPVKYEFVVCCKLTKLQEDIYSLIIGNKRREIERLDDEAGEKAHALSFIINLKKLCNHPQQIFTKCRESEESGFNGCSELYPSTFNEKSLDPTYSGKMRVLDYLLAVTKKISDDKFVLISNYTETLDAFVELCNLRNYRYVRLDGKLTAKKRAKLVEDFNRPDSDIYVFLLSSKAGGCGLNLIGANRLVMYDPDWNPANDDQAMARIWRDGQKKICYIYRLLSTGTIEEKIMQRQVSKKALSSCVVDEAKDVARHFSANELKELFQLKTETSSDTHDKLKCRRCVNGVQALEPPETADTNSDLAHWHHVTKDVKRVPDQLIRSIHNCGAISFLFHQKAGDTAADSPSANKDGGAEDGEGEEDKENEETDESSDYSSDSSSD